MATVVHRLEQALRAYEDWCYEQSITKKIALMLDPSAEPLTGALLHWQDLRGYLLNYASTFNNVDPSESGFDVGRFLKPLREVARYVQVPVLLAAWNASSRRVFHLSDELQLLLSATALDGVRWSDVKIPFGGFVITLDTPILGADSRAFDALGFYAALDPSGSVLSYDFVLLPKELGDARPLSSLNKQEWSRAISRKDLPKIKLLAERQGSIRNYPILSWADEYLEDPDKLVMDSLLRPYGKLDNGRGLDPLQYPELVLAMRLVVGLCLYLKTLPPGDSHASDWLSLSKTQKLDARAVSNGAQICTVASRFRVPLEHVRAFREGRGGYEVSAHWREGHYRRRPGTGNDPTAPRVVWGRPALVRKDRLRPGELPGGSTAHVD